MKQTSKAARAIMTKLLKLLVPQFLHLKLSFFTIDDKIMVPVSQDYCKE